MYKAIQGSIAGAVLCTMVSCGGAEIGPISGSHNSAPPADLAFSVMQNSSQSIDLGSGTSGTSALVTQNPAHGTVTVSGTVATYTPSPTFSGTDSFKFALTSAGVTSSASTVTATITPLSSGTTAHVENYSGGAYQLSGWSSFISAFGQTGSTGSTFSTATYNGASLPSRHFAVHGDASSYAGNSVYNALFGTLPVDGAGGAMEDWAWTAELVHIPQCIYDVSLTVKVVPTSGQLVMVGLLLNYGIATVNGAQELTGYQVLMNGGGGSLTLSRFDHANSYALAYMDRYPGTSYGTEANANPVTGGPYKGWSYKNGVYPAGGQVKSINGESLVAIHYQYDPNTSNTTISYEARALDGTDASPGSWDVVVNLTGADSLPPGGSFGLMPMNYHSSGGLNTTDFDIVEYHASCTVP